MNTLDEKDIRFAIEKILNKHPQFKDIVLPQLNKKFCDLEDKQKTKVVDKIFDKLKENGPTLTFSDFKPQDPRTDSFNKLKDIIDEVLTDPLGLIEDQENANEQNKDETPEPKPSSDNSGPKAGEIYDNTGTLIQENYGNEQAETVEQSVADGEAAQLEKDKILEEENTVLQSIDKDFLTAKLTHR